MKRTHPWMHMALLALLWLGLPACGGGGGGGGGITGGGIGGTGLTIGPNEQEGAVKVEGVSFDVASADISIGGAVSVEADVKQGMVAVVTGSVTGATGVADHVEIEEIVEGAVEQKIDNTTFVVLGQTVHVDDATAYGAGISPASLAGINVGDLLKVYGFVKREGVVLATRIDREGSLPSLRVRGFVKNLDTNAQTFTVGARTVDYSGADTAKLPGGVPVNGQLVAVTGLSVLSVSGEIVATRIKLVDFVEIEDTVIAKIEGFVTNIVSATLFSVGGHAVKVDGQTKFARGTALDIVLGLRLEVKGRRVNDVLLATEVEFQASVKLESDIATIGTNSFTLVGLPGIVISVNSATEYEDLASAFGDLVVGEHVEVRANASGATSVLATRVKETDASTDVELQGPVDVSPAPSNPTFSVLGVVVDTTGLGDDDFENADDQVIGRALFFGEIAAGVLVKAEGNLSGVSVDWDEMEFEGEDD